MAGKKAAAPELMGAEAGARAQEVTDEMLGEMEALTESEIFQAGTDAEEEEGTGDRTLERMEGIEGDPVDETGEEIEEPDELEATDEETDEETGEEAEVEPEPQRGQERRPSVPPSRLREESDRRRTVEQQLQEERDARLRLEGEMRAIRGQQQQPRREPEQPQKPDMFADPDGYEAWLIGQVRQQFDAQSQDRMLNMSMSFAHEMYGEEFEEAYQALNVLDPQSTRDRQVVQQIARAPNPGIALMKWHRNREVIQNLGDNPAAYIEAEVERRLAERLDGGARQQPRQQPVGGVRRGAPVQRRVPPSLNGASGSGTQRPRVDPRGVDGSEGAVFDYVFSPNA